jgi:hypothetical protein
VLQSERRKTFEVRGENGELRIKNEEIRRVQDGGWRFEGKCQMADE